MNPEILIILELEPNQTHYINDFGKASKRETIQNNKTEFSQYFPIKGCNNIRKKPTLNDLGT